MALLNEIAAKLAALGLGTVGTSIHIGMMPETPDVCCAVYEYGGQPPEFGFGTAGISYESPAVQVVFRGLPGDYATPRASAATAYNGLASVEATTLTGGGTSAFYHTVHPQQAPFSLGPDANQRVRIAFNCIAEKELSST